MPSDFGLIGYPLSHSFSPEYFRQKFENEGLSNHRYQFYPLPEINLEVFNKLIRSNPNLIGLNVTLPYKKTVIPFLDSLEDTAAQIGSVNTILIERDEMGKPSTKGFNTDIEGIRVSLSGLIGNKDLPKSALILGTGGSALSVGFVLDELKIPYFLVSRSRSDDKHILWKDVNPVHFPLIINTTPLGMYPGVNEFPPLDFSQIGENHLVFDLIYRPDPSLFLQKCAQNGAKVLSGSLMLITQAEFSYKIWTGVF